MRERKDFEIIGKELTVTEITRHGEAFCGKADGKTAFIVGTENVCEGYKGTAMAVIERGSEEIPVIAPTELFGKDICFECNTVKALGSLMESRDKLFPRFEKTAGAVMFTYKDGERLYLLIRNESGHIGFPKGHIEYGETEIEAAEREVFEETGLNFVKLGDFREEYTYKTREGCIKTGAFFLCEYEYRAPKIQHEEITDDWLLTYEKAYELLNFPEDRALIEAAEKYINKERGN